MTGPADSSVIWPTAMLPYVPPPAAGESFISWVDRVAADNELPLGLLLNAMRLMTATHHDAIPRAYGIALTASRLRAVSDVTRWPQDRIAATLLTAYDGGPIDLTEMDPDDGQSVTRSTRTEWVHAAGSLYCPGCLRDNNGAWSLAWKLPWSFACTTHECLLAATCPACRRPSGRPRLDGKSEPDIPHGNSRTGPVREQRQRPGPPATNRPGRETMRA